jgi:hypothetical protein
MEIAGALALVVLAFGLSLGLYFLPSLLGKDKRNAGAIFVLNLLLGWTFVGWVVALVWALTVESPVTLPRADLLGSWTCATCHGVVRQCEKFCPSCGAPLRWQQSLK